MFANRTSTCSSRFGKAFVLLSVFAWAIGFAIPLSKAQAQTTPTAAVQPVFDFGDTLVAYEDFPFPVVPDGELWVPELGYSELTALIPSTDSDFMPQAALDILDQAKALVEQGRGAEAITLLSANRSTIPHGSAEVSIGNIYSAGSGTIAKDEATGRQWIAQAALLNPYLYGWPGQQQADPNSRLHIWSVGLSRGCLDCASRLLSERTTRPKTREERRLWGRRNPNITVDMVPPELQLAYALVAIDIGDEDGPNLLREVMHDQYTEGERRTLPEWALELHTEIRRDALTAVGGDDTLTKVPTLAGIVYPYLRTGLVPERLVAVAQLIEQEQWQLAKDNLVYSNERGPYLAPVINALMERLPADSTLMGAAATNTLANRAAIWGDPAHAAAAALIWHKGYPTFVRMQSGWTSQSRASEGSAATFGAIARQFGRMPNEVISAMRNDGVVTSATEAAAGARTCLANASNSAQSTVITYLGCRNLTYRAWSATDEVDFGVLDDQGFANLKAAAGEIYQAEYDRRVSRAADRITENMVRMQNYRTDFGDTRFTAIGDLQTWHEDLARMNPQNFRNMPNYFDQVEEWHRAFRRQRELVASGRARDQRDAQAVSGSASTCAVWSLKVMPFCN